MIPGLERLSQDDGKLEASLVRHGPSHNKWQPGGVRFVTILMDKVDIFCLVPFSFFFLTLLKRNIIEAFLTKIHPVQAMEELES